MMSLSEQLKLIEVELTMIRSMAAQVNDDYLLYIIDMAIAEVDSKSIFGNDNKEKFVSSTAVSLL
jgi:hypothetical protein